MSRHDDENIGLEVGSTVLGGCFAVIFAGALYLAQLAVIAYAVLTILWYFDVRIDQFTPFWEN